MKLDWNNIRIKAQQFSKDWKNASREDSQKQLFWGDFFGIFGMSSVQVSLLLETPQKKLTNTTAKIDFFWPGTLLIEHKSFGKDLKKAFDQAFDYLLDIKSQELPKFLILCDFRRFVFYDLELDNKNPLVTFELADLYQHIRLFSFVSGDVEEFIEKQKTVSIKACDFMARLYDLLEEDGLSKTTLQILLVRLVFCFFADDSGIFLQHSFLKLIKNDTDENGNNLGRILSELFNILNTPEDKRQKSLNEDLRQFPYINGDLFSENIENISFNKKMREVLLRACEFNWKDISPSIFGFLFQGIMDKETRREGGNHYTSEENILKAIRPLFLDELQSEFQEILKLKNKKSEALKSFHQKISSLKFLDPACGCGNFLVVTYEKLRHLETLVLKELNPRNQKYLDSIDIKTLSKINVDKFYGIEIGPFAAKIAQIALWMTDHLANVELGMTFGKAYNRIPLVTAPNIVCGDALELDWSDVIAPCDCGYILGNPPFIGKDYQTAKQKKTLAKVTKDSEIKSGGGVLDFVCGWYLKAGRYIQNNKMTKIAFVSTNSITQGEQVAVLWNTLFNRYKLDISFAHQTFHWSNEGRGNASVHCVIIGLTHQDHAVAIKRLFSYDDIKGPGVETKTSAIIAYLFDGRKFKDAHLVISKHRDNLCQGPKMVLGVKPTNGGHYIFESEQEKNAFLKKEPLAQKFMRLFIGGREFINNKTRYILDLQNISPKEINQMPEVKKRIQLVKEMRAKSTKTPTQRLAETPTKFDGGTIPVNNFLAIPQTSSETRDYIPIGYLKKGIIPSNSLLLIESAPLWCMAILTSQMHMAWMRQVAGRMKSDYSYSVGIVYNPFPWPRPDGKDFKDNANVQNKLSDLAQNIIDTRAKYPDSSLADLYNPISMPPDLLKAHMTLDKYVDSLYRKEAFKDDRERVEHLFGLYQELKS